MPVDDIKSVIFWLFYFTVLLDANFESHNSAQSYVKKIFQVEILVMAKSKKSIFENNSKECIQ